MAKILRNYSYILLKSTFFQLFFPYSPLLLLIDAFCGIILWMYCVCVFSSKIKISTIVD
nr:MAG TPA: hypothetical protein [Caudoviricetes sp.]